MDLADRTCEGCEGGVPPLHPDEVDFLMEQIPAWMHDQGWIQRDLSCKDFAAALAATNTIGALAEQEGHHPDLLIHGYRNLRIRMQTHAVGGLTENDFILAAKIDRVLA